MSFSLTQENQGRELASNDRLPPEFEPHDEQPPEAVGR